MRKIIKELGKAMEIVAKKYSASACIGKYYEPKMPNELKSNNSKK